MDPNTTLEMIDDAINADELEEAAVLLADYARWRKKGGFEPPAGDHRASLLESRLLELDV